MKKSNKKGFTLIEVLGVIVILGMVITMISSLLFYGINVFNMTSADYEVQSSVRMAMAKTDKLVRYSRATFAVPSIAYMDADWNYIGLSDDHTKIMNYTWDAATSTHLQEVIAGPFNGITFNLAFEKTNKLSKDNTIRMYFQSFNQDETVKRYDIQSGYESLNSLQVVDYGTTSNPAIALAYRNDDVVYENYGVVVNIAMVLDVSGSMGSGLVNPNGYITTSNPSRISVLVNQSKAIVEQFASNTNGDVSINMSLVPFSTYAKDPSGFYDIKNASEKTSLLNKINGLSANGNTNTGDGLRRAYYELQAKQASDEATVTTDTLIKNYTIILVDGESNNASLYNTYTCTKYKNGVCTKFKNWASHYYEASGTIDDCNYTSTSINCTPGYINSSSYANTYVNIEGAYLSDPEFVSNYVVSFAQDVTQSEIVFIANATNTADSRVFYATDATQLGLSFTEIQLSITNELWQFLGPKLSPTAG